MLRKLQMLSFLTVCSLFIVTTISQSTNTCYVNCKQNACTDPIICTDCDTGLLLFGTTCVSSGTMAPPLIFLSPYFSNATYNANNPPLSCTLPNGKSMPFNQGLGSIYTKSFKVTNDISFMQIRFNALVLTATNAVKQGLDANVGLKVYTTGSTPPDPTQSTVPDSTIATIITCTGASGTLYAQDVIYSVNKFSTNSKSFVIEVSANDPSTILGIKDIYIYFGQCSPLCGSCQGPTDSYCLSCKGFYLQYEVKTSICSLCPDGYYTTSVKTAIPTSVCVACPVQCNFCNYDYTNKVVKCVQCDTFFTTVKGTECINMNYWNVSSYTNLTFTTALGWTSSFGGSTNLVTQCGAYSLVGGISVGYGSTTFTKKFTNLPAHNFLYLKFTIFIIDQMLNDVFLFSVSADGFEYVLSYTIKPTRRDFSNPQNLQMTSECGEPTYEYISFAEFRYYHMNTTVTVTFTGLKNYFGIRDVTLIADNVTDIVNCYQQDNKTCLSCCCGFMLINKACNICPLYTYFNTLYCVTCPITCKTCELVPVSNVVVCTSCAFPLKLDSDTYSCVDLNNTLYLNEIPPGLGAYSMIPNNWVFYPKLQTNGVTTFDNQTIIGSTEVVYKFLTMTRMFTNLPKHTSVGLRFNFFQIDNYENCKVNFFVNENVYPYKSTLNWRNMGTNSTPDAIVPQDIELPSDISDTVNFTVQMSGECKMGVNSLQLYLYGCPDCNPYLKYRIENMPYYDVSSPPKKGIKVKYIFDTKFNNSGNLLKTFALGIVETGETPLKNYIPVQANSASVTGNKSILLTIDPHSSYNNAKLMTAAINPSDIFSKGNNITRTVWSYPVSSTIIRYIDVPVSSAADRASMNNIRNLLFGFFVLGMFIGLISFFFGMSGAFDDFFTLVQVVFVHGFINLPANPPSLRVPMDGLSGVQFMNWLPGLARVAIYKGLIPTNFYQYTPMVYEYYYQDSVFARTIYPTVLFLWAMCFLYMLLVIIAHIFYGNANRNKYYNYILYFYNNYQEKRLCFWDKVVRFIYFTVCWACVLQFMSFNNSPYTFHAWNSVITIVFAISVIVYPIAAFILLYKRANLLTNATFLKVYDDLRVDQSRLFYFLFRYYKLLFIACIIGCLYAKSQYIAPCLLMVVNVVDAVLLLVYNPLNMYQSFKHNVHFYTYYPQCYRITMIVQNFLFVLLELLFFVLVAGTASLSNENFMGVGYACCVVIILLLINGVLRLIWAFMRNAELCHSYNTELLLSVYKKIEDEKIENKVNIPQDDDENQNYLQTSKANIERLLSNVRPRMVSSVMR